MLFSSRPVAGDALRGVCAENLNIVWLVECVLGNHPSPSGNHDHTHAHVHRATTSAPVCVFLCVCLVYWWWKQLQPPPSPRAEEQLQQQLMLGSQATPSSLFALRPASTLDHRQTLCHLSTPSAPPARSLCALLRHLFKFEALPVEQIRLRAAIVRLLLIFAQLLCQTPLPAPFPNPCPSSAAAAAAATASLCSFVFAGGVCSLPRIAFH